MYWYEPTSALVTAILFAVLFGGIFRDREAAPGFPFLFILFFLFAWSGTLWIAPFGPALGGFYWLPGFSIVLVIFLLFGIFAGRGPRTRSEARAQVEAEEAVGTFFSIFFWILLIGLVASIIAGYAA